MITLVTDQHCLCALMITLVTDQHCLCALMITLVTLLHNRPSTMLIKMRVLLMSHNLPRSHVPATLAGESFFFLFSAHVVVTNMTFYVIQRRFQCFERRVLHPSLHQPSHDNTSGLVVSLLNSFNNHLHPGTLGRGIEHRRGTEWMERRG
jgi:hypothetical protein